MIPLRWTPRVLALGAWLAVPMVALAQTDTGFVRANYTKSEYRVPMRDGVKLFTIVYVPKDASTDNRYPMMMQRTPYSVAPYGPDAYATSIGPNPFMMREKYIFVYQDVRGRWMSEGSYVNVRPFLEVRRGPSDIDEATDTYDTIEWLLHNVPNHNGRVGQSGISYPGFYTTMGVLSRHPALVAASPQAPVTDFYFEDFHHNGALTQGYFYTYPVFGIATPGPTSAPWFASKMVQEGLPDDYNFQLALGPLKNTTAKYYSDNFFWREIIEHPNYDAFWQARAVPPHLKGVKTAVMTVGGWFDAEDLYGPLAVYRTIERNNPGVYNTIVMGPFRHGGWAAQGIVHTFHGDIYFGDSLEAKFQRDVETPFFHHFLKGSGDGQTGLPEALMFDTGKKSWVRFDHWPATGARTERLYFQADGSLSTTAPSAARSYSEYVSDPSKPVPGRCAGPSIQGFTMYQYMSDDQRCFSTRPDVLTFRSAILDSDVTLGGEITARLDVSTTGTDADFVVKLIDGYPPDEPNNPNQPFRNVYLGGYQQMVRSEIMRGRFRESFSKPKPFVPGQPAKVTFRLQDVLHTFKRGHRIIVQVQSTMFPIFDRNPQKYVLNIYQADAKDFVKATQRIWHDRTRASSLEVQVLP